MDLFQQKQRVRDAVQERMRAFSEEERAAESRSICRRIEEHCPESISVICGYMPMRTEVDIAPLLSTFLGRGFSLALPRTEGKAFAFRLITDLTTLEPGPFGIREPSDTAPLLDLHTVDLVLVPGIAFTAEGLRLGRGNGGYDRWLKELRQVNDHARVWGVAFDRQILHSLPMEAHDVPLDGVITPRGLSPASRT